MSMLKSYCSVYRWKWQCFFLYCLKFVCLIKAKCDMWHNYKYSFLSIDMKTKVVQHVPRINISIWHMTCDMWHATCDIITNTHIFHVVTRFLYVIFVWRSVKHINVKITHLGWSLVQKMFYLYDWSTPGPGEGEVVKNKHCHFHS